MTAHTPLSRRQALLHVAFAVLVTLVCTGLVSAAALTPAPHVVVPLVVLVGIGLPMAAAVEVPRALTVLREHRALAAMRRHLARLPETPHPLLEG